MPNEPMTPERRAEIKAVVDEIKAHHPAHCNCLYCLYILPLVAEVERLQARVAELVVRLSLPEPDCDAADDEIFDDTDDSAFEG